MIIVNYFGNYCLSLYSLTVIEAIHKEYPLQKEKNQKKKKKKKEELINYITI